MMTAIINQEVKTILDGLLVGNDINLIDNILSFIKEPCDKCGERILPQWDNKIELLELCYDSCDRCADGGVVLCYECIEEQKCSSCDETVWGCDDCENEMGCCDGEECINKFCDDCRFECMMMCSDCGDAYCCQKFYMVDNGECECFCSECIQVLPPAF